MQNLRYIGNTSHRFEKAEEIDKIVGTEREV